MRMIRIALRFPNLIERIQKFCIKTSGTEKLEESNILGAVAHSERHNVEIETLCFLSCSLV